MYQTWCSRCFKEIGDGFEFCPHCGSSQKDCSPRTEIPDKKEFWLKYLVICGIVFAVLVAEIAFMQWSLVKAGFGEQSFFDSSDGIR